MVLFQESLCFCERTSKDSKKCRLYDTWKQKRNLPFTKNVLFILNAFFPPSLPIPQLSLEFQMPEPVCTVSLFEIRGREIVSCPSQLLSTLTFLSLFPPC